MHFSCITAMNNVISRLRYSQLGLYKSNKSWQQARKITTVQSLSSAKQESEAPVPKKKKKEQRNYTRSRCD
jgi:hypothetical protein